MENRADDDNESLKLERMKEMDFQTDTESDASTEGFLHPADWKLIDPAWEKKPEGKAFITDQTEHGSRQPGDQSTRLESRTVNQYTSGSPEEDELMDFEYTDIQQSPKADLYKKDYGINHVDRFLVTKQNAINCMKDTLKVVDTEEQHREQEPIRTTVGEQDKNQENLVRLRNSAPSTSVPKSTKNKMREGASQVKEGKKRPKNENQILKSQDHAEDHFRTDRPENQGVSESVPKNLPTTKNRFDMREFEEIVNKAAVLACNPKTLLELINEELSKKGLSELRLNNEDPIVGATFQEGEVETKKRFIEWYRGIENAQKISEDFKRNGLV